MKRRRLNKKGDLIGLFPLEQSPDSARAREFLNQFYEDHGLPNEPEKAHLARIGQCNISVIDAWCELQPVPTILVFIDRY